MPPPPLPQPALLKGGRGIHSNNVFYSCTSVNVNYSEGIHCWKQDCVYSFVSIAFQQMFTSVVHPSCPYIRQSWTQYTGWVKASVGRRTGDLFVYLTVFVLIGLEAMAWSSFCSVPGKECYSSLKGDFCVAWPPSISLGAFFVLCF